MSTAMTAGCVVVGNEILSGKVRDANAHHLALWLRARGVDLQAMVVVPDVVERIATQVAQESSLRSVVFTSGGVGPTHDDVTYQGVAAAWGLKVSPHPEVTRRMKEYYGPHVSPVRLRMALLPQPCTLHPVDGLWVPVVQVRNVFVLPGVPSLFSRMLDALASQVHGVPMTLCSVYTQQGEEELAELLEAALLQFPGLEIGSYPRLHDADHKVRITLESRDPRTPQDAVRWLNLRMDRARWVRTEGGERHQPLEASDKIKAAGS